MNYRELLKPAKKPKAPDSYLETLRVNFPELCFENRVMSYNNHDWAPNGTCRRCQLPIPKP